MLQIGGFWGPYDSKTLKSHPWGFQIGKTLDGRVNNGWVIGYNVKQWIIQNDNLFIFVYIISNIFVNFSATIDTYMKCLTILESPWRWLKGSEVKGAQDAAKNKSRTPENLYRIINLCTVFVVANL